MNAPTTFPAVDERFTARTDAIRKAAVDAAMERIKAWERRNYWPRAHAIAARLLPPVTWGYSFADPAGFVQASRRRGDREYLAHLIFAKLRAKAEGGKPYIALPRDGVVGSAMRSASEALAEDAGKAWREAVAYVRQVRLSDGSFSRERGL